MSHGAAPDALPSAPAAAGEAPPIPTARAQPRAPDRARDALLRRGRALEYLTLGWNALEAMVALASGILAGSTALVGFGVDSIIESSSGAVLLWRLHEGQAGRAKEERALRLVGLSFLALAGWVGWDATVSLLGREAPGESWDGIIEITEK